MKKTILCLCTWLLLALNILAINNIAIANSSPRVIQLNPNFGKPIRLPESAATIAIGDPNIADVVTVEPDLLMITGQRNGSTSMTVIGKSGDIYQYTLLVSNDVTQLKTLIRSVAPEVIVQSIKGKILLKGTVETPAQLTRVLTIADRYMGGQGSTPSFRVISDQGGVLAGNLPETQQQTVVPLSVPTGGGGNGLNSNRRNGGGRNNNSLNTTGKANLAQNIARASVVTVAGGKVISMIKVLSLSKVEIQMRIVEIDRAKTDEFGIDWRLNGNKVQIASFAGDVTNFQQNVQGADFGTMTSARGVLRGIFAPGSYALTTFVRALEEKGATSTLSEPLLTAISGEATQFMVGGSVPIPFQTQSASNNTVATATNVRYMNFGLAISVRPTVLENGKINIVLDQTMSELDYANAIQIIGAPVPGFKQKTVSTVTESESGETWAVAGLLTEEDRKNLQSVPWISNVPLLGELFKNNNDSASRNELIILVNARRVDQRDSTTTNFSGKGMLEPKPKNKYKDTSVNQTSNENELDSNLNYAPQQLEPSTTEKNIRSIEIRRDSPTIKRKPQQNNGNEAKSDIPAYKPFRGKRMDHAQLDPKRSELSSSITSNKVAIIHLKSKIAPDRYAYNSPVAHYNHDHSNIRINILSDHDNNIRPSNPNQFLSAKKKPYTINPQHAAGHGNKEFSSNTIANAIGERLKKDRTDITDTTIYSNARGVKITMDQPTHDIQELIVHNFLIGKEKTDFLNSIYKESVGNYQGTKNNSQWRVASGSYKDSPNTEVIFVIKPQFKQKVYSGAVISVDARKNQNYLVAVNY